MLRPPRRQTMRELAVELTQRRMRGMAGAWAESRPPRSLAAVVRKGEEAGLAAAAVDASLDRCRAALAAAHGSVAARLAALRHATLARRLRSVGDLAAALQRST